MFGICRDCFRFFLVCQVVFMMVENRKAFNIVEKKSSKYLNFSTAMRHYWHKNVNISSEGRVLRNVTNCWTFEKIFLLSVFFFFCKLFYLRCFHVCLKCKKKLNILIFFVTSFSQWLIYIHVNILMSFSILHSSVQIALYEAKRNRLT